MKTCALKLCKLFLACVGGEVRLFGGRNQYEGTVEYCLPDYNQWRTVCETNSHPWTDSMAMLACNATGLESVLDGKCIRWCYLTNSTLNLPNTHSQCTGM